MSHEKIPWVASSLGAFFLLIFLVVLFLMDVPRTIWYAVIPTYRYSEVRVDLTLDGVRMDVSAVAGCRFREDLDFPLVNSLRAGYYLKGGALAKRLPDGRGLVIIPRTFCTLLRAHPDTEWRAYPDPLRGLHVLLLDDAEKPTVIGYPILPQYLASTDTRLSINGVYFREKDSVEITDASEEVGWLRWPEFSLGGNAARKSMNPADTWVGYFAALITEQQWKSVTQLTETFSERTTPSADVFSELDKKYGSANLEGIPNFEDQIKVNASVGRSAIRLSSETKPWWIELRRADRLPEWAVPQSCKMGIRSHARLDPPDGLQVDGRVVAEKVNISTLSFDPATRLLVRMGTTCAAANQILKD